MLYKLFTLASLAININGEIYQPKVERAVSVILPNEKSLPKGGLDMVTGTLTLEINPIHTPVCEQVTKWYNARESDQEMRKKMCGPTYGSTGAWYCAAKYPTEGCLLPGAMSQGPPHNCPECKSGYLYDSKKNQCCMPNNSNETHIFGTITGLKKSKYGRATLYGFHVHEFGDISSDEPGMIDCVTTGAHYNPFNKSHGGPNSTVRHVGDLGNIEADKNGVAKVDIYDRMIKLNGPISVVGRSFVIHELKDDLQNTSETGNAGDRLACGTIGIAKSGMHQPTPAPTKPFWTKSPTQYSNQPTASPTKSWSKTPTKSPVKWTNKPTAEPTAAPTKSWTKTPTKSPVKWTKTPTGSPTKHTSNWPTAAPTKWNKPTVAPSKWSKPTPAPSGKCYTEYDNPCADIHGKDLDYAYFPSCTSCCNFIQCGPNGAAYDMKCAAGTYWNPKTPNTPHSNGCDSFNYGQCKDKGCELFN